MKPLHTTYRGVRLIGPRGQVGGVRVTVDGRPLALQPSLDLCCHSPTGFEWGYGGSGPSQLALAILLDATEDSDLATLAYTWFKWAVVANWRSSWQITVKGIVTWIYQWEQEDRQDDRLLAPALGCVAPRRCRGCGCTDADCRKCIVATGSPCVWVPGEPDLCSRCAEDGVALVRHAGGAR